MLIPNAVTEIDINWLTMALSAKFPDINISDFHIQSSQEVTNQHVRIEINYQKSIGAPEKVFCKLLPNDPVRRKQIAATHMGIREAMFYKHVAPNLQLRTPEIYYAHCDNWSDKFILIMEDILSTGCTVSDGTQSVAVDSAARALEDLANLHAQFESSTARSSQIPWLTDQLFVNWEKANYGPGMLQYGLDHHRHRLTPGFAKLSEIYIKNTSKLHELWAKGQQTLIHGDTHIGNLFDDHGHVGFLDWGIISINPGLHDVSLFLTLSLSIEDRRKHQKNLIQHYLDVRNVKSDCPITFEAAWRDYLLHAVYVVPACCQIVTFPPDATDRRKTFADAFLARTQAAIDDLDLVDNLKISYGIT